MATSDLQPLVLIPTYNERENIAEIVPAVRAAVAQAHVLVIDDASPDGTGALAETLAAADPQVHVLHRPAKQGLGPAYFAGFAWGLAAPVAYTHFISFDADFSHDPTRLPAVLAGAADVVIGSRYVAGGGTRGWPLRRRLLSRAGSLYARTILGLPVHDVTAGYVCYRRAVIEDLTQTPLVARGYGFQIEMKHRAHRRGYTLLEVPIVFPERTHGASKMTAKIASEALRLVWQLRRLA